MRLVIRKEMVHAHRRDRGARHRWRPVRGGRVHPPLRHHGQHPLPLVHLHLFRPPQHAHRGVHWTGVSSRSGPGGGGGGLRGKGEEIRGKREIIE